MATRATATRSPPTVLFFTSPSPSRAAERQRAATSGALTLQDPPLVPSMMLGPGAAVGSSVTGCPSGRRSRVRTLCALTAAAAKVAGVLDLASAATTCALADAATESSASYCTAGGGLQGCPVGRPRATAGHVLAPAGRSRHRGEHGARSSSTRRPPPWRRTRRNRGSVTAGCRVSSRRPAASGDDQQQQRKRDRADHRQSPPASGPRRSRTAPPPRSSCRRRPTPARPGRPGRGALDPEVAPHDGRRGPRRYRSMRVELPAPESGCGEAEGCPDELVRSCQVR